MGDGNSHRFENRLPAKMFFTVNRALQQEGYQLAHIRKLISHPQPTVSPSRLVRSQHLSR